MRVLLVGGHKHGEWYEYDGPRYGTIRTIPPFNFRIPASPLDPLDTQLETEDYRLERVPINIEGLKAVVQCGIWTSLHGAEKTRATIRALFQRDIAEMFREGDWNSWD